MPGSLSADAGIIDQQAASTHSSAHQETVQSKWRIPIVISIVRYRTGVLATEKKPGAPEWRPGSKSREVLMHAPAMPVGAYDFSTIAASIRDKIIC